MTTVSDGRARIVALKKWLMAQKSAKCNLLLPSVAFLMEEVTVDTNRLHSFFHRFSKCGIESICTQCFLIVAKAYREGDLERFEHVHNCDPLARRLGRISRPVSTLPIWQDVP